MTEQKCYFRRNTVQIQMKAEPSEAEVEYAGISEYEQLRLENIKRNEEVYYH